MSWDEGAVGSLSSSLCSLGPDPRSGEVLPVSTVRPVCIAAIAAMSLCATSAAALAAGRPVQADAPRWSASGFGTLGAAWRRRDDTQFRRSVDQHRGTRANELDFGVDSSLGLQVLVR